MAVAEIKSLNGTWTEERMLIQSDGSVVLLWSTNDDFDQGYPSASASARYHFPTLKRALEHIHGGIPREDWIEGPHSHRGCEGAAVNVYLDGVRI